MILPERKIIKEKLNRIPRDRNLGFKYKGRGVGRALKIISYWTPTKKPKELTKAAQGLCEEAYILGKIACDRTKWRKIVKVKTLDEGCNTAESSK